MWGNAPGKTPAWRRCHLAKPENPNGQSSPPDLHSFIGKSVGIFSPFQMSYVISKQAINLAAGAKGVRALGRMERVCLLGAPGGRKHEAAGPGDYSLLLGSGRTRPRAWVENWLSFTKPAAPSVKDAGPGERSEWEARRA